MTNDTKKYREVVPVGHLYTQGLDYYLLSLHPVKPDWEQELLERRFAVVPIDEIGMDKVSQESLYSYARHIVVRGDYIIEYSSMIGTIKVWDVGDVDLSNIEELDEDEPNWNEKELSDMLREAEENNND